MAEITGFHDIMTFRRKTSQILPDYFNMFDKHNEETHKGAIIKTAAKFIKSDIKCLITYLRDEFPKLQTLNLNLL